MTQKINESEKKTIIELESQGLSNVQIAKKLTINEKSVRITSIEKNFRGKKSEPGRPKN